ncbi:MAG: hypothetical protein ACFCVD_24980 [Nodosilinea sp.]
MLYPLTCTLADQFNGFRVVFKDSVIVNGFWRSGTTWIMELAAEMLKAKTVFEPFNPPPPETATVEKSPIGKCLPEIQPPRQDYAFVCGLMPYVADRLDPESRLAMVVEQALRGRLKRRKLGKKTLQECLRPRVVTKFTRGSLCLRPIQDAFAVPVLHVIRDPRAVIASIKHLDDGNFAWGTFNNFPLKQHLLGIPDGRVDYFTRWAEDIEMFNQATDYHRLAAYYCLTERYFLDSFHQAQHPFTTIRFEAISLSEAGLLRRALDCLGLPLQAQPAIDANRPSSTDWGNLAQAGHRSIQDRIFSWQKKLTTAQQHAIDEVVRHFAMTDHLWPPEVLEPARLR